MSTTRARRNSKSPTLSPRATKCIRGAKGMVKRYSPETDAIECVDKDVAGLYFKSRPTTPRNMAFAEEMHRQAQNQQGILFSALRKKDQGKKPRKTRSPRSSPRRRIAAKTSGSPRRRTRKPNSRGSSPRRLARDSHQRKR